MTGGLSLLDLAQTDHRVLVAVLHTTSPQDVEQLIDAASAFLVEVLATYEIARRSFLEESTREGAGSPETST